jgi:hypothetical protein
LLISYRSRTAAGRAAFLIHSVQIPKFQIKRYSPPGQMKPQHTLDRASTPDGGEVVLYERVGAQRNIGPL